MEESRMKPNNASTDGAKQTIPFDTLKFTVCWPHVQRHIDKSDELKGWKREAFDSQEAADAYEATLRENGQRGIYVITPSEAVRWNAGYANA